MAAASQTTPVVNHITREIIGAAMKVHTLLGPGLLESAYEACLVRELRRLVLGSKVKWDWRLFTMAKRSTSGIEST